MIQRLARPSVPRHAPAYSFSLNRRIALLRPILMRSFSLMLAASNQMAAWSMFSNGQSVENMMRSDPISSMASIRVWVRKLPDVVRWKLALK